MGLLRWRKVSNPRTMRWMRAIDRRLVEENQSDIRTHWSRGLRVAARRAGLHRFDRWLIWTALLLSVWFLLTPIMVYPWNLNWDETFYAAQASSFAHDFDYDIGNDLFHTRLTVWSEDPENYITAAYQLRQRPDTRIQSTFAVGTSLLWAPAIWMDRLIGWAGRSASVPAHTPRFAPRTQTILGLWSAFLGGLTVFASYVLARGFRLGKLCSATAAVVCFVLTPMAFWTLRSPGYSHMSSAFAVTLFLVFCRRYARRRGLGTAMAIGVTGGLCYIVRWADAVYLPIALVLLARWVHRDSREGGPGSGPVMAEVLAAGASFFLIASFQWLFWRFNFGEWITVPQGNEFMHWGKPEWSRLLWNSHNAFLPWAPAVLPAAAGLLLWLRREPLWGGLFSITFAAVLYVASVSGDVEGGWSFGSRRLTSLYPILVVGGANFLRIVRLERSRIVAVGVSLGAWVLGMFLIRLRELDVRDLLAGGRELGWTFGDRGEAAVRLILRSDLLAGLKEVTQPAFPLLAALMLTAALWAAWQGALALGAQAVQYRKAMRVALGLLLAGCLALHALALATRGRDDRWKRQTLTNLREAIEEGDRRRVYKLAEFLQGDPRYELQAAVLSADFFASLRRWDAAVLCMRPALSRMDLAAFPQLRKAYRSFLFEALAEGRLMLDERTGRLVGPDGRPEISF